MACRQSLHCSPGALSGVRASVLDYSILHCGTGHNAHHTLCFPLPVALIVNEEEEPVFLNRPAKESSEIVSDQLWRGVRSSALQLSLLDEIIVRAGGGGAVGLQKTALEIAGSASGAKQKLPTGQ